MRITTSLSSIALAVTASYSDAWLNLLSTRGLTRHCPMPYRLFSSSSDLKLSRSMYEVLLQNETTDAIWIQSISAPSVDLRQGKTVYSRRGSPSVKRAIEQVDAILDLYNATGGAISSDIALNALEGVIVACFQDSQRLLLTEELLEQLEDLVWRFGQFQIAPSSQILECLWRMQQCHGGRNNADKASKQVGRSVHLLTEWYRLHNCGQVAPVPDVYLSQVIDYALENGVTMSFAVWDLYRSLHENYSTTLTRSVYTRLLDLLGTSSADWRLRQCRVLQDMMVQARRQQDSTAVDYYKPNTKEIQQVLVYAVKSGRVQDAAWLLKILPETSIDHKLLFLQAVLRSNESGSALYMERLVESWSDIGMEAYKLLLKKWSLSRTKSQGRRARAVFDQIQARYLESGKAAHWTPDARCVSLVVQAYLQEPAANLTQVINADHFVRICAEQGFLHEDSCSLAKQAPHRYPWRVFDWILEAYSAKYYADDKAREAADQLFQFFLIQHRIGKLAEDPDQYHLGHILRLWSRKPSGGLGAYKSLEYFNLFERLRDHGIIQVEPDEFNVRQLLGTLARSDKSCFGDDASRLLNRVLAKENFVVSNRYALGHMFWCAVKCHCNERTLQGFVKALETVDRMEQLYEQDSSLVQVTGASYATVLKTLSSVLKTEGGDECNTTKTGPVTVAELAKEAVERIEKQHQQGNKRVLLARNLYLDAIRCCKIDIDNEVICNEYREKLSRLKR